MQALISPLTIFLALLLAMTSIHKFLEPDRLANAAARLLGVASRFGWPLSLCAAVVELAAAVALLAPFFRQSAAIAAAGLCGLYAILLFGTREAPAFDCGCVFGSQTASSRLSSLRALVIALVAVSVAALPDSAPIGILDIIAAVGIFSLYLATSEILAAPTLYKETTT